MGFPVLFNLGRVIHFHSNILTFRRFLVSYLMNSIKRTSYEEAVYALNGLQSNALVLKKAREERSSKSHLNITITLKHLQTLGIQPKDLDDLNVVHVSGTKGKGSTCAFTESIIRHHGFKTGFYSSPHLISVNERIRINGQPLDKELFVDYFWKVYKKLQSSLEHEENMPPYFMFLTIMAFYVFVKEKVQAAIVEVGIGGLYDCTNILRNPVVIGVSTLGMDHVSLLGNTIQEIAMQKAGIFKPKIPVFTVYQPINATMVLKSEAQAKECPLRLSPPFEFYPKSSSSFSLGVPGIVQNLNASLALQLSKVWLDKVARNGLSNEKSNAIELTTESPLLQMAAPFDLNPLFETALRDCDWPGRFQTLEKDNLTFYLDGAHTQQSIKLCTQWFEEAGAHQMQKLNKSVLKVLLFNCTGDRKAETLLGPLSDLDFDMVLFSPNQQSVMKDSSSDQSNFMVDPEKEMEQCLTNKEIWSYLKSSLYEDELSRTAQNPFASKISINDSATPRTLVFSCLNDVFDFLLKCPSSMYLSDPEYKEYVNLLNEANHVLVLVTGSLHLVGGVLSVIESR